jgi:hypothetical protein
MNYNLIGYLFFLLIIALIILVVGKICYRNGNVYLASLLPGHLALCQQVNKILLICYYLVNIGYACMTLVEWETISSAPQLVEVICFRIAVIIGLLSVLHYINIYLVTTQVQKLIKTT